jgi:hypothetical protein
LTIKLPTIIGLKYRLGQLQQRTTYALRAVKALARLRMNGSGHPVPIAAVMVGRNDDYQPNFAERLHATLEWNVRHLVDEVVFVEWNPPVDRELLSYKLAKCFPCLRAYVVPPEIHYSVCENPHVLLLEFHAKNVGIRRAQAPWIITTNADAAFGLDTIICVRKPGVSDDAAWSAQRIDIDWPADHRHGVTFANFLRYKRVIPWTMWGAGEFHMASKRLWEQIRGYDEAKTAHRWACDARGTAQMIHHGADLKRAGVVLHLAHPTSTTEDNERQLHHGDDATLDNLPYLNPDNWGMRDYREVQIAERVWRLEQWMD